MPVPDANEPRLGERVIECLLNLARIAEPGPTAVAPPMDESEVLGDRVANEEADSLGLEGDRREDHIAGRIDELNDVAPSIVERAIRDERGEVVASWTSRTRTFRRGVGVNAAALAALPEKTKASGFRGFLLMRPA